MFHNRFSTAALGIILGSLMALTLQQPGWAEDEDAIPIAEVQQEGPVDFEKQILPIMRRNCLACHNSTEAESDLVLEDPQAILKGGAEGPAAVPGNSGESLLLLLASRQRESYMPPEDNEVGAKPLTPQELGLIKLWIDQGAKGQVSGSGGPIQWQQLPPGVNPIYSVTVSPDGQYAAAGRANQIFVYHVPSKRELGRLTDPALIDAGYYTKPGVAHLDLVQSLAFAPNNRILVSGGYRTVKVWQRPQDVRIAELTGLESRANALATSAEGTWAAWGQDDGKIQLLDLRSNQITRTLEGHAGAVTDLQFSPDASRLISSSLDKSIRIWNTADGTLVTRIDTPSEVSAITVLSEAQLASAGPDKLIRLWSTPAATEPLPDVGGTINGLASSADKKWLAAAREDGKIVLIDVASNQLAKTLDGHPGGVISLAFSASANRLVTGGMDGQTGVWELGSGQLVTSIPTADVAAVAIHPNGAQIVTGSKSGSLRQWKLDVPAPRALAGENGVAVTVAAVSPNGKLLATVGTADGKPVILLRDLASGAVTHTLAGHEGPVTDVSFSADGNRLISASQDKTARLWDVNSGQEVGKLADHETALAALNSNGQQAVTLTADNALVLWNVADGKSLHTLQGHSQSIVGLAITANNQFVVSASADQTVRIWNAADGQQVRSLDVGAPATALALSSDGNRLAVAAADKTVKVFQVADGKPLATCSGLVEAANSLSFSPDHHRLLARASGHGTVFEAASGKLLEQMGLENTFALFGADASSLVVGSPDQAIRVMALRFQRWLGDHTQSITRLIYANDGNAIFSASADGSVRRFVTADGKQQFRADHGAAIHDLALSPNQQLLASAGEDKQIRIWNAANGAPGPKPQLAGFAGPVRSVTFSWDSAKVVGGDGGAKELLVFDLASAAVEQVFAGHRAPATAVAALAAGEQTRIVSAAAERDLATWQLVAGRQLAGHSQAVTALARVNDGQLISGSSDGTLRHWQTSDGRQLRQINHGGPVTDVAATPDGARFASASANNTAKLWNAADGKQLAEMRGDFRAKIHENDLTRSVALAKRHIDLANADLKAANDRKKAEEDNAKKAEENRKKAEDEFKKKEEAAKKPLADKAAADKALADAQAALPKAEEAQKLAAAAAAKAAENLKQAQQTLNTANKAASDAATAAKQAADALQKASEAAKQDENNQELADAKAAAEKAAQEAEAKSKAAAEAKAAAEKQVADATAAKQAADQANTKAQQALKTAQANVPAAEANVKKLAAPAQKATDEKSAAQRNLQAAQRSVERANAAVKNVADTIPALEGAVKQRETAHQQTQTALEEAKKASAESEKPWRTVAFSPDGSMVVTAGEGPLVHTWDAQTGAAVDTFAGHQGMIHAVAFTADNNVLSAADDKSVVLWATNPPWTLQRTIGEADSPDVLLDRVTALSISGDGKWLASGSGEPSRSGELKIWNLETGELVREIKEAHSDTLFGLQFSRDGKYIASCGADRFVKVFQTEDGKFVRSFEGHTHHVLGVSWSADGRTLASAGADQVIKIWNVQTGDQQRTIQGFGKEVTSICFVSDSINVVASCGDKNIHMKRTDNGGNVRTITGGTDYMYSVAASGDGKTIVAGGQDSVLRIWNDSGQVIATFAPPQPEEAGAE